MSNEHFPQPEQPETPDDKGAEGIFGKNEASIQRALLYINEVAPTWILNPEEVTIEQPSNQKELIDDLYNTLGTRKDGDQLQSFLLSNLKKARRRQDQPEDYDFRVLDINLDSLAKSSKLTEAEYDTRYYDSPSNIEIIENIDQTNEMVAGLLAATGAEMLRSNAFETGTIERTYKGMLEGRPVYFEELIHSALKRASDPNPEKHPKREFKVVSEYVARLNLDALSLDDEIILHSIGVDVPMVNSSDFNPDIYPTRSRMVETLRLYEAMYLSDED